MNIMIYHIICIYTSTQANLAMLKHLSSYSSHFGCAHAILAMLQLKMPGLAIFHIAQAARNQRTQPSPYDHDQIRSYTITNDDVCSYTIIYESLYDYIQPCHMVRECLFVFSSKMMGRASVLEPQ